MTTAIEMQQTSQLAPPFDSILVSSTSSKKDSGIQKNSKASKVKMVQQSKDFPLCNTISINKMSDPPSNNVSVLEQIFATKKMYYPQQATPQKTSWLQTTVKTITQHIMDFRLKCCGFKTIITTQSKSKPYSGPSSNPNMILGIHPFFYQDAPTITFDLQKKLCQNIHLLVHNNTSKLVLGRYSNNCSIKCSNTPQYFISLEYLRKKKEDRDNDEINILYGFAEGKPNLFKRTSGNLEPLSLGFITKWLKAEFGQQKLPKNHEPVTIAFQVAPAMTENYANFTQTFHISNWIYKLTGVFLSLTFSNPLKEGGFFLNIDDKLIPLPSTNKQVNSFLSENHSLKSLNIDLSNITQEIHKRSDHLDYLARIFLCQKDFIKVYQQANLDILRYCQRYNRNKPIRAELDVYKELIALLNNLTSTINTVTINPELSKIYLAKQGNTSIFLTKIILAAVLLDKLITPRKLEKQYKVIAITKLTETFLKTVLNKTNSQNTLLQEIKCLLNLALKAGISIRDEVNKKVVTVVMKKWEAFYKTSITQDTELKSNPSTKQKIALFTAQHFRNTHYYLTGLYLFSDQVIGFLQNSKSFLVSIYGYLPKISPSFLLAYAQNCNSYENYNNGLSDNTETTEGITNSNSFTASSEQPTNSNLTLSTSTTLLLIWIGLSVILGFTLIKLRQNH